MLEATEVVVNIEGTGTVEELFVLGAEFLEMVGGGQAVVNTI
mgnify:CR=1 FL=1